MPLVMDQSVKVLRPEVQMKERSKSIIRQSTNRVLSLNKQANIYSSCVSNCRSNSIQEILIFLQNEIYFVAWSSFWCSHHSKLQYQGWTQTHKLYQYSIFIFYRKLQAIDGYAAYHMRFRMK